MPKKINKRYTAHQRFDILSEVTTTEIRGNFDSCRLCWAISKMGQRFPSNIALYSTEEYVVIPALGSLVSGYVLLVSKEHHESVASLEKEDALVLEQQLNKLLDLLKNISSNWVVFEHGSTQPTGLKSCCVEHLHLHLFPLDFHLATDLSERLSSPLIPVSSISDLPKLIGIQPCNYLFIRDVDSKQYLLKPTIYPSQYVRQVLAANIGIPHLWDWREHPQQDVVISTINIFKDAKITPRSIYFAHAIEGLDLSRVARGVKKTCQLLLHECANIKIVSMYELLEEVVRTGGCINESDFDQFLVETETEYLKCCDLILADVSIPDWQYVGTLMEIAYANILGIPVIAVIGSSKIGSRRWLKAHVSEFAHDMEGAAILINKYIQQA
jgi:diadenosine tetraphosphate (Ap4A) HIT family hydrolase